MHDHTLHPAAASVASQNVNVTWINLYGSAEQVRRGDWKFNRVRQGRELTMAATRVMQAPLSLRLPQGFRAGAALSSSGCVRKVQVVKMVADERGKNNGDNHPA